MWLTVDERRLLAAYALTLEKPGEIRAFEAKFSCLAFKTPWWKPEKVWAYSDNDKPALPGRDVEQKKGESFKQSSGRFVKTLFGNRLRVEVAHKTLCGRGLITMERHEDDDNIWMVGLTVDGFLLGKKYADKWSYMNLAYQHHKEGVFGLVWSGLFGIVGGILSHWAINSFDGPKEPQKIEVVVQQPPTSAGP